ncbi:uncharacterized protein FTOL_09961 [Fusarium torulosum]|uniref:DUF7371 domain-containing protein n=1 Tax=Fusarium torulosum TaxID=33205 RepID=A0AAE8MFC3_9HYPO|nr:uncharacterized protein FTOL_09961 [Fusarium torulosum]
MRITASIGVLVVTGLFGHSASQATDYGNPNGSPLGNSADGSRNNIPGSTSGVPGSLPYPSNSGGSVPGSLPSGVGPVSPGDGSSGLPPNGPGGVPGGGPVVIPGNFPTNAPPNVPGSPDFPDSPDSGASNLPTCPFRSTTTATVVVTVYPTGNQDGSDFHWPDDSDSDEADLPTPTPTNPAQITPLTLASVVPPFTTLTLDIWGPDGSPSGTDAGDTGDMGDSNPSNGNGNSNSPSEDNSPGNGNSPGEGNNSGNGNNPTDGNSPGDGSDDGNTSNDGSNSGSGGSPGSGGENGSQTNPNSPLLSSAPGTNGAPEYSDSDSSAGLPGASGVNTPTPGATPVQTLGSPSNGVVPGNQPQLPSTGPAQEASGSLPVTTQAGPQGQGENSPWFTYAPGGSSVGQPSPSSTAITGQDGLPTIISSGGSIAPGQGQPPTAPGFSQNSNTPGSSGGSFSGFPLPPSAPTGFTGSQGPFNSQTAPLTGSGPVAGIITCATLTITGTDGLPTVVDSTWVVPLNTPASADSSQLPVTVDPQASLSGIPLDIGSIPTVVDSTWVASSNTPISGSSHLPFTFDPQAILSNIPLGANSYPTVPISTLGSPQDGPGGSATATCTSYTVIGPDGLPTVVHSTWAIPIATPGFPGSAGVSDSVSSGGLLTITGLSTFAPSDLTGPSATASNMGNTSPITTCSSYTVVSTDGLPTVVDSTWIIPGPTNTGVTISSDPEDPSQTTGTLPNGATSDATKQTSGAPELPASGSTDSTGPGGIGSDSFTTCISYTITGSDGLPTVVDSTLIIPGSVNTQSGIPGNPSFVSDSLPSGLPTGNSGPVTTSAGFPSTGNQNNTPGLNTCITYTVIGADGVPTITESTFVIPTGAATPTGTSLHFPITTIDGQAGSSLDVAEPSTIITTAAILGPDGKPTTTVQTIILSDSSALGVSASVTQSIVSAITTPTAAGPLLTTGDFNPLFTGAPSLNGYDAGIPNESLSIVLTDASAEAQGASVTGTTTGTLTWTVTSVTDASGNPVVSGGTAQPSLNPSGDGVSDQLPQTAYGPVVSESTLWPLSAVPTNLQTSTWTNIIKAETTSYTIDYPLTTLATVAVPGKRLFRRQENFAWYNSTTTASSMTLSSSTTTASETSSPSICAIGGSIGNTTIDFDNSKPGPLFNPVENIWFSGGFLIAPPTSHQPQPYIPSSGGQLVEFVPPALSNTTTTISGDVAQIGVGPHAASPCFRFNFFGANLGCDARGDEKWCEFEISAYRWNETSSTEESIAWSETKQIPACSTFSEGGYELTRVDLDGYKDLSSILITVRVSSNLRVWWGDDFRVGWTDNTCIAASCRTNAPSQIAKRETVLSALRQGVYQWTPNELKRLEDSLV